MTTLGGLRSLTGATGVQVISFAEPGEASSVTARFTEYWGKYNVELNLLHPHRKASVAEAFLTRRFQSSTALGNSALRETLNELDWRSPDCLLVFDDIAFAPFMPEFGENCVLSPHDCMSGMFLSHCKSLGLSRAAAAAYARHRIARYYERRYYGLPLLTHVLTHRDRVSLQRVNPRGRYHVVPNGEWVYVEPRSTTTQLWDVMIWADLSIAALAKDTRRVLLLMKQIDEWSPDLGLLVVGRVPRTDALEAVGRDALAGVSYSPYLEDSDGKFAQAKITLIPDTGGAGIKSRCLSVLAAGGCLACLYSQTEGIEKVSDRGAINASDLRQLLKKIAQTLKDGTFREIAQDGTTLFRQFYGQDVIREGWLNMIRRAVVIRRFWTSS